MIQNIHLTPEEQHHLEDLLTKWYFTEFGIEVTGLEISNVSTIDDEYRVSLSYETSRVYSDTVYVRFNRLGHKIEDLTFTN